MPPPNGLIALTPNHQNQSTALCAAKPCYGLKTGCGIDAKLRANNVERSGDGLVHVVVLITAQTACENNLALTVGKLAVLLVQRGVALVVDGVIRLVARLPVGGVLARDNGLGLRAELKMLVLDDAGVGHLALVVVHDGDALVVGLVKNLGLETQAAVLKLTQAVVVERVDGAAVDHAIGDVGLLGDEVFILDARANLDALEHVGHHLGVAAHGDALEAVVEIVVVVGEAARQAFDDGSGQVLAVAAPLLLSVTLHKLLKDIAANQRKGLLLEVLGLADAFGVDLLLDLGLGFCRRDHAPHFGERVHVEGHVVDLALVVGDGAVHVVVELGELVDVAPNVLHRGVEDMCAVTMNVDALDLFGVNIAGDVVAPVDDQALLADLLSFMSENGAGKTSTNNQVIVLGHISTFQKILVHP